MALSCWPEHSLSNRPTVDKTKNTFIVHSCEKTQILKLVLHLVGFTSIHIIYIHRYTVQLHQLLQHRD